MVIRRVISIIVIIIGYILGLCLSGWLLISSMTEFFTTLYHGRMTFSLVGMTALECIASFAILAIFTYSSCAIAIVVDNAERRCKSK